MFWIFVSTEYLGLGLGYLAIAKVYLYKFWIKEKKS